MNPIVFLYKAVHWILSRIGSISHSIRTRMIFLGNGVEHSSFRTTGVPYLVVARGGKMKVGSNFAMNNGIKGNPIGCYDKCTFFVDKGGGINHWRECGNIANSFDFPLLVTCGEQCQDGGVLPSIRLTFMHLIWRFVGQMRI